MSERDPLDELRRAWAEVRPPAPDAPVEDEATRASVEWMRSAWNALEAPATSVPAELRDRRRLAPVRNAWRVPRWLAAVSGVAAAVLCAVLLWRAATAPEVEPVDLGPVASGPPVFVETESVEAVSGGAESGDEVSDAAALASADPATTHGADPVELEEPEAVAIASIDQDRMELRSGSVRLVLITSNPDRARSDEPDEELR